MIELNRRFLLQATPGIPLLFSRPVSANASIRDAVYNLPLETYGVYSDTVNYAKIRKLYFNAQANGLVFERLWREYSKTRELWIAESVLAVGYGWWRTEKSRAARLKVAKIGARLATTVTRDFPDHPAGYMWHAVFVGIEALTRGILDSLYLIPGYQASLQQMEAKDPSYFYGFSKLLLAKIMTKTPPRPLSIGNVPGAINLLKDVENQQRGKVALWYLFMAEALYLNKEESAAFEILDAMADEVLPVDVSTAVMLDQSLSDADHFRLVVHNGDYNKYTWDPVLTPPRPSPKMDFQKYGIGT